MIFIEVFEYMCSIYYIFRFEYVFRLNIQSIKDCDPMKFTRETGPHYVSQNN